MGEEFYSGISTYTVYDEETSYGSGGTPANANKIGRIENGSLIMNNNIIQSRGSGEGVNVNSSVVGKFDVNGSITWEVDDFNFFQYFIGTKETDAGSGPGGEDVYEITERENYGYSSTTIPTLQLEIGNKGLSNDQVYNITGVFFETVTLNIEEGKTITATTSWKGKTVTRGTSIITYTSSTLKPFVSTIGYLKIDSESVDFSSFSLTCSYSNPTNRGVYDRFLKQPSMGIRSYTFSLKLRKKYDDTASTLSGVELLSYFLGNSNTPLSAGTSLTARSLDIQISEGSTSGDRVVSIELENVFFDEWPENWSKEGEFVTLDVKGHAHSGKADSIVKVPIRYYTTA